MFLWLKIKGLDDTMDLAINNCLHHGVFVLPGSIFYYNSAKPSSYLRLSYSYASDEDIDKVNLS